jgi:hypothetical protein
VAPVQSRARLPRLAEKLFSRLEVSVIQHGTAGRGVDRARNAVPAGRARGSIPRVGGMAIVLAATDVELRSSILSSDRVHDQLPSHACHRAQPRRVLTRKSGVVDQFNGHRLVHNHPVRLRVDCDAVSFADRETPCISNGYDEAPVDALSVVRGGSQSHFVAARNAGRTRWARGAVVDRRNHSFRRKPAIGGSRGQKVAHSSRASPVAGGRLAAITHGPLLTSR